MHDSGALPLQTRDDRAPALASVGVEAQGLLLQFRTLVHERDSASFDSWLERCEQSAISEVVGFAQALRRDYAAVKAACSSPWSQGPVEGQVNRLKTLKRKMYGRASFALLRCRVLHQSLGSRKNLATCT
ncbi:MAG: transposase [Ktedonobacterales bacterium]